MGLLSKAETLDFAENLSAKSNSFNSKISFSEFISKNKIHISALFENIENKFYITNSIGFDANTICSSESTKDFWDGLCSENIVKTFTKKENTISPLLQFFSFAMSDKLERISILKSKEKILLLCNQEISTEIKNDFSLIENSFSTPECESINSLIDSKTKCVNFTFKFENAINNFLESNKNAETSKKIFAESLFNELANRIIGFVNINSVKVFEDSYKVKAIFTANKNTPSDLLKKHLIMTLFDVCGIYSDSIEIVSDENCESFLQLKNFLQEE